MRFLPFLAGAKWGIVLAHFARNQISNHDWAVD